MERIIERINTILNELKENKYSYQENENVELEQKNFFTLQNELFKCFNEIYEMIKKSKLLSSRISSRIDNINNLKEELEYYSDSCNPSTIEYAESLALFTEMSNNMAHVIEDYIKDNDLRKNRDIRQIRVQMYDVKTIGLNKIAKITLNKENEGIIVGVETDDYKSVNNKVLVLDLPRYGQLSWHYNNKRNINNVNNIEKLPTYRYKMQKGVMDSRETSLNSKLLLGQGHINDLNIHNKIDRKIPFGHENELKLALDIYYDILNNKEEYATYESKLRGACLRHGIPSKETFDMILDRVMDTMFGKVCYQREKLEKWRDNIENER